MASSREHELHGFVDEPEDISSSAAPAPQAKGWFGDPDETFAYKTFKVVRIKDSKLGLLYWGIVTMVIMYTNIWALGYEGKHQFQEPGIGTVITKFSGKAFFGKKVFDEADLRFPVVEPNGAFIMTRRISVKEQRVQTCLDYDNECPCRAGATCQNGFCVDQAWCPSLGDGNVDTPLQPPTAEIESIEGIQNTSLHLHVGIAFPGIGNKFFVSGQSTSMNAQAMQKYRDITVGELLGAVDPPVDVADVLEKGALIAISFFWNCEVDSLDGCEPAVIIKRLDNNRGFSQKRVRHAVASDGVKTRDAMIVHGIRVLVDSSGIGRQFSIVLLTIQIGSGLALLRTAGMCSDFLMLKLYGKERSQAYYKCKVKESEDYSDLQDRINLIKEQKEETIALIGQRKERSARRGAGAGVSLGLGPGGRGGMASLILPGGRA